MSTDFCAGCNDPVKPFGPGTNGVDDSIVAMREEMDEHHEELAGVTKVTFQECNNGIECKLGNFWA